MCVLPTAYIVATCVVSCRVVSTRAMSKAMSTGRVLRVRVLYEYMHACRPTRACSAWPSTRTCGCPSTRPAAWANTAATDATRCRRTCSPSPRTPTPTCCRVRLACRLSLRSQLSINVAYCVLFTHRHNRTLFSVRRPRKSIDPHHVCISLQNSTSIITQSLMSTKLLISSTKVLVSVPDLSVARVRA